MFRRVKGTQDFLDMRGFLQVVEGLSQYLVAYHFTPIQTPILEHGELFIRSLGEHTDVVHKEMFFVANKSATDTKLSEQLVLRPELTASIMRAFVQEQNAINRRPWRVYSWGPSFRYERPQKGRYRQFHQFSMEIINAASILYDAELISALYGFFSEQLKLVQFVLEVNYLGSSQERSAYKKALVAYLDGFEDLPPVLAERKNANVLRCFDLKDEASQKIMKDAPLLIDFLQEESLVEWQRLQNMLQDLAIPFVVNPRLVRGLDYYNKTVFEFSSSLLGAQSAFCGGGRYDYLAEQFDVKNFLPALGAGIGIERLVMLLESENKVKDKASLDIVLVPFSQEETSLALLYAQKIRSYGCSCETLFDIASVKSMMRLANKQEARYAFLIGSDEREGNYVLAKDMATGEEHRVTAVLLEDFCRMIKSGGVDGSMVF